MTSPRVRMSPESRREQLLELGQELMATRSLDELSIDLLAEEAGISRGLLYHYFGNKTDFHLAVVRAAAADLIAQTAPLPLEDPIQQLAESVRAYLTYVREHHAGYVSLVRGAAGGNDALREVYVETHRALTDRIFAHNPEVLSGLGIIDSPEARMFAQAWGVAVENAVLSWLEDDNGVTEAQLVDRLVAVLAAFLLPVD